jgi:hypothetical protein
MWPIQLAFRLHISCRIFLCSLTLIHTSSFLTGSVQLIFSILLQHHISKLSRSIWSTARSVQVSAPYKTMLCSYMGHNLENLFLLECDVVPLSERFETFRRKVVSIFKRWELQAVQDGMLGHWRWRKYISLKCRVVTHSMERNHISDELNHQHFAVKISNMVRGRPYSKLCNELPLSAHVGRCQFKTTILWCHQHRFSINLWVGPRVFWHRLTRAIYYEVLCNALP